MSVFMLVLALLVMLIHTTTNIGIHVDVYAEIAAGVDVYGASGSDDDTCTDVDDYVGVYKCVNVDGNSGVDVHAAVCLYLY